MTTSPALAFAVAAAGIALFSTMDALMKGLVLAIGAYSTLLWRNLVGVGLAGALYFAKRRARPSVAAVRLHLARGVVATVMALLFFWGLARVPMAQAIALSFVAPLATIFLAAAVLGERVRPKAVAASVVALGGVGLILAGQARAELGPEAALGAAAILVSALFYAVNLVLMRAQSLAAEPEEVALSQALMVSVLLGLAAPFLATWPEPGQWPAIVGAAGLATASLLLLSWAYARGEAGRLATTEYTGFLWAALWGWVVFGEPLSAWTVAGAVLIVAGCLLAARGRPEPLAAAEGAA